MMAPEGRMGGRQAGRRDDRTSHVVAAITADVATDNLVFFGDSGLSRTYPVDARLARTPT